MNGDARRQCIFEDITLSDNPLSASKLAKKYNVSRQIIVGDIALLRASGNQIVATARGYIIPRQFSYIQQVAVVHKPEDTLHELQMIVDHGGFIIDVTVEHPVYGSLTGNLNIKNNQDIARFLDDVAKHETTYLSSLTNGVHLHSIACQDETTFIHISKALKDAGFLYTNN